MMSASSENVAALLRDAAWHNPDGIAIAEPQGRDRHGKRIYRQISFRMLDEDSTRIAQHLAAAGIRPGTRLALLVPPGIDFISLVFGLFKAGVVVLLIDPGMGRANMVACLAAAQPEGFVAISLAQAVRCLLARRFPLARCNVTVGRRWFWGGPTLAQWRATPPADLPLPVVSADDPAAIIFTTGSTGPPKGVLYQHRNFTHQARQIQQFYQIQPGEIDLPGFPLFALFNCAMGVTAVIPDMDPTRPARVDPRNIIEAVEDWQVTQAFGSPALWNAVGRYCEQHDVRLPTVRRVLSAGAPVPAHVLQRIKRAIAPDGDIHTPYGATEALPVASIAASEVLSQTLSESLSGKGTCVGRRFPGIDWKIIAIRDEPIPTMEQIEELPATVIGELIVRGPVVTQQYVTRLDANALHKIRDGDSYWHRMGDVGYLDLQDRFWFCGRKSHRLITSTGTLFTIPCEAIFNQHPVVYRSALVGIGPVGRQEPVIVVEPWPEQRPRGRAARRKLLGELRELGEQHPHTASISRFLIHAAFPVDIRHNAKIRREQLAVWAARKLRLA